ncbi:MAG: replicative DNA helicase [Deltaproteobacteria bacterium]|nr:replicative DNA helicase [Deltaproteobacteria bacterium]
MNNENQSNRLPPQNLEAERSVLGGVLLDNAVMDQVLDLVGDEDFYKEAHRQVFLAMREMAARNEAIDYLTLEDHLRATNLLAEVGGPAYISALTDAVPSVANIDSYAKIVRNKAVARRLIHAANEILRAGFDDSDNLDAYIDEAETLIFNVTQKRSAQGVIHIKDLVQESFNTIEKLYERKAQYTGVPCGFKKIDEMTSGMQAGDMIVIAARPSMGKTSFALNIAQNAALHSKVPVLFFSLEMSKESLAMRMLCSEARVDFQKLRSGILSDSDWGRLARAAGLLSEANLYIDDTAGIRVIEMRARARRLQAELQKQDLQLGMIVMDYLQLASPPQGRSDSREREISEISRGLKGLAKELSLPVLALSQLSRKVESRENKRPQLSDLRESGAIEQDADVIMFIYRDDFYNEDSEDKNVAEIIIGKQRNGPTGVARLRFFGEHTRFETLADGRDDDPY